MNIQIDVRVTQPPAGEVCVGGAEPRPFTGWLQLLRILSDVLAGSGENGDERPLSRHLAGSDTFHARDSSP